jgi:hypothetical protein
MEMMEKSQHLLLTLMQPIQQETSGMLLGFSSFGLLRRGIRRIDLIALLDKGFIALHQGVPHEERGFTSTSQSRLLGCKV